MPHAKPPYLGTLGKRAVLGSDMNPVAQATAKKYFVHRYTGEHKPAWASEPPVLAKDWLKEGHQYPVQFKDDVDWLANTFFRVNRNGDLLGGSCESHPTWPNGRPDKLPGPPRVAGPKTVGELNAAEDSLMTGLVS